jgi:hypothetical protein
MLVVSQSAGRCVEGWGYLLRYAAIAITTDAIERNIETSGSHL